MNKMLVFSLVLGIIAISCGPRLATKKTLTSLKECEEEYTQLEKRLNQLNNELENYRKSFPELENRLRTLEKERDSLKKWLEILEKGY